MADEEELDSTESVEEKSDDEEKPSERNVRKCHWLTQSLLKEEKRAKVRKISNILKKLEEEKTAEDLRLLAESPEITKRLQKLAVRRDAMKQRTLEIKDPEEVLQQKCDQLADAIRESKNIVVYTGAGISTAASIPDYRGPNGVWTMLLKGQQPKAQDLSDAEPTTTHMCITQLEKAGHIRHVVSQNCDGLHLRSGFPRKKLSEVHGNMYIELCNNCKPHQEYIRLFDVTEKTGVRRHATGRNCHQCKKPLRDTIVHFGEKGGVKSPYRWKEAGKAADNCDLILCLGSSLKILKIYSCLWCMDRRPNRRPKLFIVNLQWTPKDDSATLKINGCCDDVMKRVMDRFGYTIPLYSRNTDPIFRLATPLRHHEKKNVNKKILDVPANYVRKKRNTCKKVNSAGKKGLKTDSHKLPVTGDEVNAITVVSPPFKTEEEKSKREDRQTVHNDINDMTSIKPRSHTQEPIYNNHSNHLPCTVSVPSQEPSSSPLDLSMNGPLSLIGGHPWPVNYFNYLPQSSTSSSNSISQDFIGRCPNCDTSRRFGLVCSCTMVPRFDLLAQGMPTLPFPNMSYLGIQMMSDPRFNQLPPLPLWPHPLIPPVLNPNNKIDDVLKDHCYLKKDQMQKLSPKRDKMQKLSPECDKMQKLSPKCDKMQITSPKCDKMQELSSKCDKMQKMSPTDKSHTFSKSAVKREICFEENVPLFSQLKEEQKMTNLGKRQLETSHESSRDTTVENNTPETSDRAVVANHRHKRSKTSQDIVDDIEMAENDVESTCISKKPKLCRSLSVPGWFGKGLKIGKKKRM